MNGDYTIPVTCNICKTTKTVVVKLDDYEKWVRREGPIQELLHYISAGDRELLISGTCDDCFNSMFGDEE